MATKTQEKPKVPAGAQNVGKVVQVIGPVLDVEFEPERLPEIYNAVVIDHRGNGAPPIRLDRKSTRLNSSHGYISYAVFCLKKKKKNSHCVLSNVLATMQYVELQP